MPGLPILVGAVHRYQPALLTEFDRNENRAIIADGGRAHVGCLHLTSPMVRVVANPNLSDARSPPHGIYDQSPTTFGSTSAENSRSERSALSTGMLPGVKCSDTLSMPPTLSL